MVKRVILLSALLVRLASPGFCHDNKYVHPLTLTMKSWFLLREKTGWDSSPYIELDSFFDYEVPRNYPDDPKGECGFDPFGDCAFNLSTWFKAGAAGTVLEDVNSYIGSLITKDHFYDPFALPHGLAEPDLPTVKDALAHAEELWADAIGRYGYTPASKETAYKSFA